MTLLWLSPTALARCRFAISPLAETVGTLIALQRPCTEPWFAEWHGRHQAAYHDWLTQNPVAANFVPLIAATKLLPDVVSIPPSGGLAEELALVAAQPDEQVRASVTESVAASWLPQDTGWLALDGLGPRVAEVLQEAWNRFVAPDWPRRRAVLERDVMHRAGLLAVYGWRQAVDSMRGKSIWVEDNAIRFSDRDLPDRWIGDEGLIFVPRTTPGGWWTCERPPHYALVYLARGTAAPATAPEGDALATLLGPGRARVLRELTHPATSTQLAQTLGVSLGTVSSHLAVLRDAGAVTRGRTGRHVVYQLAPRGEQLIALLS